MGLLLASSTIFGGLLRIMGAAENPDFISDEGISFLAATGHEGEYADIVNNAKPPYGRWAPATDWRRLILPERRFCFGTISADLVEHDLHPPLYFWLLHVWILIFGVYPWTGLTLNLLFFLGTTACLYRLGVLTLGNGLAAAAAVALWSCSPTVIPSTYEARPYELLALCTVAFTLLIVRLTDRTNRPAPWHFALLGFVSAAGILTHYHFTIALCGGAIYAVARLVRTDRRRLAIGACACVIGLGLASACHPIVRHIGGSNLRRGGNEQTVARRFDRVYARYRAFIMYDGEMLSVSARRWYVRCLPWVCLAACGMLVVHRIRRRVRGGPNKEPDWGGWPAIFFLAFFAAGNAGLYVLGISPAHAIAAKYPCMVWPFLALFAVLLTEPWRRWRGPALVLLCGAMACSGSRHVHWTADPIRRLSNAELVLPTNLSIIVDNPSRLALPRLLHRISDDSVVLAATAPDLVASYDTWRIGARPHNFYFTGNRKGAKAQEGNELIPLVKQDFTMRRLQSRFDGFDAIYVLSTE